MRGDQPAFPDTMRGAEQSIVNQSPYELPTGLTIREKFALAAMQGLLSNPYYMKELFDNYRNKVVDDMNRMLVRESIDMADELLKQLES